MPFGVVRVFRNEIAVKQPSWVLNPETGCWDWAGRIYNGRAYASIAGRPLVASKLMWDEQHGAVLPSGTQLYRLCDTPHCVRPDHHIIRSPRTLWRRLGRSWKEVQVAVMWMEVVSERGEGHLSWRRPFACAGDEVRRAATHLSLDTLTILSAFAHLSHKARKQYLDVSPKTFSESEDAAKQAAAIVQQDILDKPSSGGA